MIEHLLAIQQSTPLLAVLCNVLPLSLAALALPLADDLSPVDRHGG